MLKKWQIPLYLNRNFFRDTCCRWYRSRLVLFLQIILITFFFIANFEILIITSGWKYGIQIALQCTWTIFHTNTTSICIAQVRTFCHSWKFFSIASTIYGAPTWSVTTTWFIATWTIWRSYIYSLKFEYVFLSWHCSLPLQRSDEYVRILRWAG